MPFICTLNYILEQNNIIIQNTNHSPQSQENVGTIYAFFIISRTAVLRKCLESRVGVNMNVKKTFCEPRRGIHILFNYEKGRLASHGFIRIYIELLIINIIRSIYIFIGLNILNYKDIIYTCSYTSFNIFLAMDLDILL